MIRRALVVAAGLFAAVCVACVPAEELHHGFQPPPPPSITCAYDRIKMLPAGPPQKSPDFVPPVNLPPAPDPIAASVRAAVDLAPDFFRGQLCALNGIFIVPSGKSWGLRNPHTRERYIALSADLWSGGSPPDLTTYEQGVLQDLLSGWNGPSYTPGPHDPAVTILDVLAHEFGHVLFFDTFVLNPGDAPTYNNPAFCGGGFYFERPNVPRAWSVLPPTSIPWRSEMDVDGSHLPDDIQISQIQRAPIQTVPPLPTKGDLLSLFYSQGVIGPPNGHGRWASLYGGFTPDHDFVETFKLFVLMKSHRPLTTLVLNVPTSAGTKKHDIPASCDARSALKGKLTCFQRAFCRNTEANACNADCQ